MRMNTQKSRYELNGKESISHIKRKLRQARKERRIYVIAHLVRILRYKGLVCIGLTKKEERCLIKALREARYGKKPLAEWLPRGYQIARFIFLVMLLMPERNIKVKRRDKVLIKETAKYYRKNWDRHSARQLKSLSQTARCIGVRIRASRK